MSKLNELLSQLHLGLAEELLKKIKTGEACAADLNVVRQFLKDNGVDSVPSGNKSLEEIKALLPELPTLPPSRPN